MQTPGHGCTADRADGKALGQGIDGDRAAGSAAEKIGAASRFTVLPPTAVAGIITDAPADADAVRRLAEAGVPILHA